MVKRLDEENPFLREIWALGFDKVLEDRPFQELILVRHKDKFTTRIPMLKKLDGFTIKASILPDGKTHTWLAESDGSAQRFRDLIQAKGGTMSNKKQSSIEWLLDRIEDVDLTPDIWEHIKQQAKAMHKEEIEKAWNSAGGGDAYHSGEQYYNETFGGANE